MSGGKKTARTAHAVNVPADTNPVTQAVERLHKIQDRMRSIRFEKEREEALPSVPARTR